MPPPQITSRSNPQVKQVVRLQTQSSARREAGRFCVETARDLQRLIAGGGRVVALFVCPEVMGHRAAPADIDAPVTHIARPVLEKMAYRESPEGMVAVAELPRRELADLEPGEAPLIVVCSGLEKPGNLGAILRSADAAGVDAVLIDDPACDLGNPNCIRASTGAVFALPIVCAAQTAVRGWLTEHGIAAVAASPDAQTPFTSADLTGGAAIVVGAEAEGLSEAWRRDADRTVRVPMRGRVVDSLNVSVTAALLMFEARRQRDMAQAGSG